MADKVLFYRISKADYQNILNKDGNSVYWITDEGKIYLGDRLQAEEGPVKSINGKTGDIIPEIDDINNLTLTISGIQVAATNLSNLLSLQTTSLSSSISTLDTTVAGHETDISALQSQQSTNNNDISTIKGKIPTQATTANQLADKAFVNSSIGSLSANYVTYNATGNGFPTKAALTNASKFYYGGVEYTPTKSDYCLVIADESAPYPFTNGQTRYVMANNMWAYQYGVNETPFTAAQNAALNSGITSTIVSEIDDKLDKTFTTADAGKLLEVQSNGTIGLTSADSIERNTNKKTSITNDTTGAWYPTVKSIYDSYGQAFSASNTITNFVNRLYPIGTIYTTLSTTFNPNGVFPGSWSKTGEGKVLVGETSGNGMFVAVASNRAAYSTDGINWTAATVPSNDLSYVAYGNGMFVVVGNSDKAAYSTDGINWTAATMPSNVNWRSVTYGNGMFVAVASNRAAYSTDGINWTVATMPSNVNLVSVTYGNGMFVAVSYNNLAAAYSTDGINWTVATMPSSAEWVSVAYGNGMFVAVSSSLVAAYSTDGINWTETTLSRDVNWYNVTYGGGKFVVVTSNRTAYSTDGINWTETSTFSNVNWRSVTYGNGMFVVTGINIQAAYSTDGINWTAAPMPSNYSWYSVTYGVISSLGRLFSVGESQNGEYTHTLTEPEIPSHKHYVGSNSSAGTTTQAANVATATASLTTNPVNTASVGGGGAHNNMPPYMVVIFWRRNS